MMRQFIGKKMSNKDLIESRTYGKKKLYFVRDAYSTLYRSKTKSTLCTDIFSYRIFLQLSAAYFLNASVQFYRETNRKQYNKKKLEKKENKTKNNFFVTERCIKRKKNCE